MKLTAVVEINGIKIYITKLRSLTMTKGISTVAALIVMIVLPALLFARGADENAGIGDATLETYTIEAFFPGDTPLDFDKVLAKAEELMKDEINVNLDFIFVPWSDYGDKIKIKIAAGDDFDLHLNAQWLHIYQLISNGSIQPWDSYLEAYGPHVIEAFPEIMLESNKFDGKIMGIPLGHILAGPKNLGIRKDLRVKYGMEKPDSYDDLYNYLNAVVENEEGMMGMTWIASTNFKPEHTFLNYLNFGQNNAAVYIHFDEQGRVLPIQPIYEDERFLTWCEYAHQFYQEGLIQKDIMAQKDDKGAFLSGQAACAGVECFENPQLTANVPDGIIEQIYFTGEPGQNAFVADFKMWNFLCLNSKSKNPERVTRFYDWIFSGQSHYDLLKYGLEGVHWVAVGEKGYDYPTGKDASSVYTFPGYVLLDNPNFDRTYVEGTDEYKEDLSFRRNADNFIPSQLTGFTPNYENIKNEMAKVGAIWGETIFALGAGVLDPVEALPGAIRKLKAAGYDAIVEEARKQVADFLSSQD